MSIRSTVKAVIIRENKVLLNKCVRHGEIYYNLPGGGQDKYEDMESAVRREVMEETSSRIAIISDFRATVKYSPSPGVMKEVVYFLAFTTEESIKAREGEIAEVEWVPLEEAENCLTHENDKTVFRAAMERMQHLSFEIK